MVLGGDPQLAYEAGLLVALYAAMKWFFDERLRFALTTVRERAASPATGPNDARSARWTYWTTHRLVLLAGSAALGGLLSAVQILPTQSASRTSIRSAREVPSNLFEIPGYLLRGKETGPAARHRPAPTGTTPSWEILLPGEA